jgi:hypothetical protein
MRGHALTWAAFPTMKEFNTYFELRKYSIIATRIDTGL